MDEKNEQVSFFERDSVRKNTDAITDMLDKQAIENIKALQERRNFEEELLASLHKLNSHSLCPGSLPTCEDLKKDVVKKEEVKEVHPNPNFFQKHRMTLLIGIIWTAIIILAVGWSPTGATFEAIQNSWVDLIVNFFKIGIFAIAGIATYNLVKKHE